MKTKLSLSSFYLKNFKAVQDSKTIKFTPLTAFIGNNGSGKSSIVVVLPFAEDLQQAITSELARVLKLGMGMN